MKYIKTFESHLRYDEIDLDIFTSQFLVGRSFRSEEDAKVYLNKSLEHDSKERGMEDFTTIKTDSGTLTPYKIYPLPTDREINRNEASKFIEKHGYVNGFYPMYAYIEYKHIDEIKRLGVKYVFKPLSELKLTDLLNDYVGKVDGLEFTRVVDNPNSNSNHSTILKSYFSESVDKKESKKLYNSLISYVNSFNDKIGSDYHVVKIILNETRDSIRRGLLKKLKDDKPENYNPNEEMSNYKKYDGISIVLERGADEDEFLAMIEMENRDKPVMIFDK
jgi:hypothetical protein